MMTTDDRNQDAEALPDPANSLIEWEHSWVTFLLLHTIAPLLISVSLLAMVINVTGSGPWLEAGLLSRNLILPPFFAVVTWTAMVLIARAYRPSQVTSASST